MDSSSIYSLESVPDSLTKPSISYTRHAWLATIGLLIFVGLYIALTGWFLYTTIRLMIALETGIGNPILQFVVGLPLIILTIFMLKALFFIKRPGTGLHVEITEKEEPKLFNFIYQLADQAGAPRPEKVYLSNIVNAGVFYDLSVINLILPSKKNLEIGLGLINVLSLGEVKAVIAHEFGHFAQRSMLIGRWVYIAQQIASHIISKRDFLDEFLAWLSSFDIRIAWLGWIISLIVWAIRAVAETLFSIVMLAQRALSREMEFHADLVATSLTGSDALVHALHRLEATDRAYGIALETTNMGIKSQKAVLDIYTLQSDAIRQIARILNKENYGESLVVPSEKPEAHRVFSPKIAHAPKMWATHPPNHERENNMKSVYIQADVDKSNSWELFEDPIATRQKLTALLIETAGVDTSLLSEEESLELQNKQFRWNYFDPKYRGMYLDRDLGRGFQTVSEMYEAEGLDVVSVDQLSTLYPESLTEDLEQMKELQEEQGILNGLKEKFLKAPGGVILHRGKQIQRKNLPEAIHEVKVELQEVQKKLDAYDCHSRSVHLAAAKQIGKGWEAYLKGTLEVLHYAEHTFANLRDVWGLLKHVLIVVTADGRVSSDELSSLESAAYKVFRVVKKIHKQIPEINLDTRMLHRMEMESWAKQLEDFTVGKPSKDLVLDWIASVDNKVIHAIESLGILRRTALELLLETEEHIADLISNPSKQVENAPLPSKMPASYDLLLPGKERPFQMNLSWWDRLYTADGTGYAIIRLFIALLIVGFTIWVGNYKGNSSVVIYNGLSQEVLVDIGDQSFSVDPYSSKKTKFNSKEENLMIRSWMTDSTMIEEFSPSLENDAVTYVYNIASAAALSKWTVYYGYEPARPTEEQRIGAPRWSVNSADIWFREAPEYVKTQNETEIREVIFAYGEGVPEQLLAYIESPEEQAQMISAHASWDDHRSKYLLLWLLYADRWNIIGEALTKRLERTPNELVSLRMEQEIRSGRDREEICKAHQQMSEKNVDNADWYYLATRCIEDKAERNRLFLAGYRKWPDHPWLAISSGIEMANQGLWKEAYEAIISAVDQEPVLYGFVLNRIERIRRMAMTLGDDVDPRPDLESSYVNFVKNLDDPSDQEFQHVDWRSYIKLAKGELYEAIQESNSIEELRPAMIRMVAASEGADAELISLARNLSPDEGINEFSVWVALAFAKKHQLDTEPYLAMIQEMLGEEIPYVSRFLEFVATNQLDLAETETLNINFLIRGEMYMMGIILLEEQAPEHWRIYAKSLLFASERPFFRDAEDLSSALVPEEGVLVR